jgi:hypothetical protein
MCAALGQTSPRRRYFKSRRAFISPAIRTEGTKIRWSDGWREGVIRSWRGINVASGKNRNRCCRKVDHGLVSTRHCKITRQGIVTSRSLIRRSAFYLLPAYLLDKTLCNSYSSFYLAHKNLFSKRRRAIARCRLVRSTRAFGARNPSRSAAIYFSHSI